MTELRVVVSDEIAERLAQAATERGASAEDVAAEVLSFHAPDRRGRPLSFIAMFDAPGALSVAEAERRLEDGEDEGFAR